MSIRRLKKKIVKAKNQLKGAYDIDRVTELENAFKDKHGEKKRIEEEISGLKVQEKEMIRALQ